MVNIIALTEAVQWAVNEHNTSVLLNRRSAHNQNVWGVGRISEEVTSAPVAMHPEGEAGAPGRWRAVSCLTGCCIAGHAVVAAGDRLVVREEDAFYSAEVYEVSRAIRPDGTVDYIRSRAMELLDLTYMQADLLFGGSNTIDDIIEIATELAADAGYEFPTFNLA